MLMVTANHVRGRCLAEMRVAGAMVVLVAPAMIVLGALPRAARADSIILRGGGQVQGKVVPDPNDENRVHVWLLQGRKPLSFLKSQILEIVPKASPLDDYLLRRQKTAETAQAQFELGTWCEEHKLTDLARLHFEAALVRDRSFGPAHEKLGHIYRDGYWLTRDELSELQGLVKYKGRWMSAEEKARHDAQDKATASQTAWIRRIKLLRQAIASGPTDRQREAEIQMMSIRESEAVGPLVRVLGEDEPPMRILLAQVLSGIEGPQATAALAKQVLAEPTSEVRSVLFEKLKDREDPAKLVPLVRALSSANIAMINRAAWVLGNLGVVEAVPKLIHALLTDEQHLVMVPTGNQAGVGGPPAGYAPLAVNGSSAAILTPPAVGPGVVAYGVMSAPFYNLPIAPFDLGAQIQPRAEPRFVTFTFRNTEVLSALRKLTEQDFGYDVRAWRKWVSRDFNPHPKPARTVPQP
jgi:hypothetical protein